LKKSKFKTLKEYKYKAQETKKKDKKKRRAERKIAE
jgi:hypothetical protein